MRKFSTILTKLRKSKGLTQTELSKELNISRSSVGMYESGKRQPDFETLELIADYFNVDIDYLLGRTLKTTILPEMIQDQIVDISGPTISIPVLEDVAAGMPIFASENYIDYVDVSVDMAKNDPLFGLRVKGDSMSPRISEGDTLIVRQQDDAESGDIVVVLINGDSATYKRLMKYAEGISLISLNPAYEPMMFTNKEIEEKPVKILGKVIEGRQKF